MPLKVDSLITNTIVLNGTEINGGGSGDLISTSITLTPSQVQNLFSSPITLVPAQGVDTGIQVIAASVSMKYNSVPYSGEVETLLLYVNTGNQMAVKAIFLNGTSNAYQTFNMNGNVNTGNNEDLKITLDSSDLTQGNSPITIYFTYKVIKYS